MKGEDIFCKLYEPWKNTGKVIFENDTAYSILSVTPAVPGHAIIITKDHIADMGEMGGNALEEWVSAFACTFEAIQRTYDTDVGAMAAFYESLKANPPAKDAGFLAGQVLKHPHLKVRPSGYNLGMNIGEAAGQTIPHLHIHLFPRRERGEGIVTAMREFLAKQK
ncbi:MAG TPA: HIT family protein [Nanoarchaeota archaeon]|nr:HIT family protein [Nanoarchaeota archaeon]